MEQASGSALKWVIAVVGLILVVLMSAPAALQALGESVQFEREDTGLADLGGEEEATEAPEPVEDGTAQPTVDFLVVDGVVRGMDQSQLTIAGPEEAMVLAFPLIEGDESCVESVTLEMSLVGTDGRGRIGIHPSGVFTPMDVAEGDGVVALLAQEPGAIAVTNGALGRLMWDVTDLYRTWVQGAVFGPVTIPDGVPFTIAVRATGQDPDAFTFAASEAGDDQAPAVSWTGSPECG